MEEGMAGPSEKVKAAEAEPRAQPCRWPRRHAKLNETKQRASEDRASLYAKLGLYRQGKRKGKFPTPLCGG